MEKVIKFRNKATVLCKYESIEAGSSSVKISTKDISHERKRCEDRVQEVYKKNSINFQTIVIRMRDLYAF